MLLRSTLVLGMTAMVCGAVYGCSSNNEGQPGSSRPDSGPASDAARNDSGEPSVCPSGEVAAADITRATATLTMRTPAPGSCTPSQIAAFRALPSTATVSAAVAALGSDTCRQCALSDVNDDLWSIFIFRNTTNPDGGSPDSGANRVYTQFLRPNDFQACFANFGSQGCGRYILRRGFCADSVCIQNTDGMLEADECPTDNAYDLCLDQVFSADGICIAAERALAWDSECTEADFNRASAKCRTLGTNDMLDYVCGSGMLPSDAGAGDGGPTDGGPG